MLIHDFRLILHQLVENAAHLHPRFSSVLRIRASRVIDVHTHVNLNGANIDRNQVFDSRATASSWPCAQL